MGEVILLPYRITRRFIQSHPEWIFLYGCDYANKSFFGQSYSAFNEPNAFPIPTLLKVCNSSSDKRWRDSDFEDVKKKIDERISNVPRDGRPIIPFPKIGMGDSDMFKCAPALFNYMQEEIKKIAYPFIEIDYSGKVYPLYDTNPST
jgi:hypothetical protein